MMLLRSFLIVLWALLSAVPSVSLAQGIGPQLPSAQDMGLPNYDEWSRVAVRTERAVESGVSSTFALERLRAEIADWRDRFLTAQSINSARIATVQSQIAALGAAPAEGETEDATVAARRAELSSQLNRLRAPVLLAEEAYAQVNGLISEIDRMIREKDATKLTARGASPLEPQSWVTGAAALWTGLSAIAAETRAATASDFKSGEIYKNFTSLLLMTVLGLALIIRGRHWVHLLQNALAGRMVRGVGVWNFLLSLGLIALPFVGLVALEAALLTSGVLGFRGAQLASSLAEAGVYIIVTRWFIDHYFAKDELDNGPLEMCLPDRLRARRIVNTLGWTLAAGQVMLDLVAVGDTDGVASQVLVFPIEVLVGVVLFRFGRLLSNHCHQAISANPYRYRIINFLGQVIVVVAVLGPLLAGAGYAAAAEALIYPAVKTLGIIGVVILLQRLVTDFYILITGAPDSAGDALIPVLVGFVLLILAMPVLALTWGARQSDLLELWARFREGFQIGDTRISPTDFMMFILIFGAGYAVTRFIQGTLKSTVLPKTRIDIGGQNAITSGLGYIGIFLAALIAITTAGIDLSSLAIVAGALSVGIGFGLQNIVSNFVSGIILLIERPISEGDMIEVNGNIGYVRDISVRSTRIETFDRTDVIIPNADLVAGQVTNWTRGNSVGRLILPVGVGYKSDTHQVEKMLREVAESHPMVVLAPKPNVFFMGLGADSLNFEIRAIIRDISFIHDIRTHMLHEIVKRFTEAGIEIPFAQRDIWLRNPEALRTPLTTEET